MWLEANLTKPPGLQLSPSGQIMGSGGSGEPIPPIAGVEGPATFVWVQETPAQVWEIPHNLGRFPSVTATDQSGEVLAADVEYIDENNLTITFGYFYAGTAYLN